MGVSPVCVLLSIGLCVCVRVEVFRHFDLLKHKVFWWLFRFVCLLFFSVFKFQIPDLDSATVIGRVKPVAVSNLLGGKSLDSENFHWKISREKSRFWELSLKNLKPSLGHLKSLEICFTVFIPWGCGVDSLKYLNGSFRKRNIQEKAPQVEV